MIPTSSSAEEATMADLPEELQLALEADDRHRLDTLIERADPADEQRLKDLVSASDTPETYRRRAMYALSRWPGASDDAVTVIEQHFASFGELERITAVSALGHIGTEKAVQAILARRDDAAPDVRRQVAKELGRVATPTALEQLREIRTKDASELVREVATKQLQQRETP
jgi:HEAT repeat protein